MKIRKYIHKYILEITVFICGMVVMVFEIVGSRVLGPYLGTSIFVWTSLIGIILGSLSIGYYLGGKIADKNPSLTNLSFIIFLAAVFIFLTILVKDSLLSFLQATGFGIKTNSVLASLVLFLPTSVLLGMVSPYTVKLKMNNLRTSGSTVGNLYAISTVGSITGTFLAGFYLVPKLGTTKILILLSAILVIISIIIFLKQFIKIKLCVFILILFSWFMSDALHFMYKKSGFIDIDTEYGRIWIYNYIDTETNKLVKGLKIDNENNSAMFVDSNGLVYEYTKYYHLVNHFNPDFKKALMIGGGAYSYPKDYLIKYPRATIDVVEIDAKLTEIAKEYFNLKENQRLNIYHEDGRTYINRTLKKYDVIFGDAFKSGYSLPYQLTTKEVVRKKYDILNNNGLVILNIISSIEGRKGEFLRAEYATYKNIFPQVYLFLVENPNDGDKVQNIILVAIKSTTPSSFKNNDNELNEYLQHLWKGKIDLDMPILTDDYAPVDYYISKTI